MKTFLSIMVLICISTFLGLVIAALVAKTELDHIVNVARGGTDDESNLQSLCVPCHKKKTQQESRQ